MLCLFSFGLGSISQRLDTQASMSTRVVLPSFSRKVLCHLLDKRHGRATIGRSIHPPLSLFMCLSYVFKVYTFLISHFSLYLCPVCVRGSDLRLFSYEGTGLPVVTLFTAVDLEKNSKGFDYYANRLRKVAVDFKEKLVFNIGDKSDFEYLLDDYDLELTDKKDIGVGLKLDDHYYHMEDSFSVDNLRVFLEKYLAGELTPKIKETPSEPPSSHGQDDDEDDGTPSAVVTLTNDNFNEVVMAEGTDVMVEFYAPWCGHCMQLKPTYKKLAGVFEAVPSVTVAAMDATAHDIPEGFDVQGYPTILFLANGAKDKPVSYDGARELSSMVSFIKTNAAVEINDEL